MEREPRREARHASVALLANDLERDLRQHAASLGAIRMLVLAGAAAVTGFVGGLVVAGLG